MKNMIYLLGLVLLLVACQGGDAGEPGADEVTATSPATVESTTQLPQTMGVNLGESFTLQAGETVTVADTEMRLTFTAVVEDSRCPTMVSCFWTGRAVIEMDVQMGDDAPQTITFDTNPAPTELLDTITVYGYTIHLERLDPYPEHPDNPIAFADYYATLVVSQGAEEPTATEPAPQPTQSLMEQEMKLGEPFVLTAGQEVILADAGLSLTFTKVVEDSRCPTQVDCVWSGRIIIELEVRQGDESLQTIMLQTSTAPSEREDTAEVSGYTIFLENVAPYPEEALTEIQLADYRATVVVSQP